MRRLHVSERSVPRARRDVEQEGGADFVPSARWYGLKQWNPMFTKRDSAVLQTVIEAAEVEFIAETAVERR